MAFSFSNVFAVCMIITVFACSSALGYPSDVRLNKTNLRHDFAGPAEIPAAFTETTTVNSTSSENSKNRKSIPSTQTQKIRVYPACKDGSGGLCVPNGSCSADLKPETRVVGACNTNQECCFGVPASSTFCADSGGSCVPVSNCGKAPQLKSTECNHTNGDVCCIFVF